MHVTPTVLVTGAAGGLGRAILDLLARREVSLFAVDRDADVLAAAVGAHAEPAGQMIAAAADVGEEDDVRRFIAEADSRWGRVDALINTAAILGTPAPFVETAASEFDEVMRVNARSVWLTMKHAIPAMLRGGGGSIVNVGSYAAIRAAPGIAAYAASKHAVVGMTQTVAVEFATSNIRANVVCPGSMDTPMIRRMFPLHGNGDAAEGERITVGKIPQRRLAQPSELAETVVWLALDAPTHLSGQVIAVDGARSAS
jgi:NAD(P)-dependent dehydrogenase (short-subunit alcohol dehydrogenase family)